MYCSNCGAENGEGAAFCAHCGKSHTEYPKIANYPLIYLSSRLFYPIFEICLWINLIVYTAGGGIASYYITGGRDNGNPLPGILIGFVVGFLAVIICGGTTSIFLKMNESIGKIDKSQILLRLTSGKSSTPPRSGGSVPAKPQSGG